MAVGGVVVTLAFLLPLHDAGFRETALEFAFLSVVVSATSGTPGATVMAILLSLAWVTGPGVDRRRGVEFVVLALALALFLAGGARFNERVLKRTFEVPRPNIELLAKTPSSDAPVLGMSADAFYAQADKAERRAVLERVLNAPEIDAVLSLPPIARAYWRGQTGFSLPSGHAFASCFLAMFFLLLNLAGGEGWRWILACCLPVWAVLVCYARLLLFVHTPADVLSGGFLGVGLGSVAAAAVWLAIARLD